MLSLPLLFLILIIYFWLHWVLVAVHGLSPVAACGFLIAEASLGAEHRFHGTWTSVVAVHRISCPAACEILPGQGSNLCALPGQADSQPLDHQGSPVCSSLSIDFLI